MNMMFLPILAVSFTMKIAAVLFVLCSVSLILIILVQKGRGGGLSGAFGGGVAGGLLGSKTGDFLTWVTIVLVAIFLSLAILMAKFYRPTVTEYGETETVRQQQPTDMETPAEIDYDEAESGDANTGADMDVPGG
jgi:preprotein translocase subunit SecG